MADLDISISTDKSIQNVDNLKKSVNILSEELKFLDTQLSNTDKHFKSASEGAKVFKTSLDGMSGKTGVVGKANTTLGTHEKRLGTLVTRYEKVSKAATEFANANKNLETKISQSTGAIDDQRKAFRRSTTYSKTATMNFKQLGSAAGATELALTALIGASGAFIAVGLGAAVLGVSRALLDVELATDRAKRQISILTGDMGKANAEFDYAVKVSKDLGLNFISVTKEYAKFLAASKSSTLSTSQLRETFVSFSKALAATQASSQDTELVFLALNQMISKGRVSSEELRRQLSERLPGAFQIAAKSLGLTVAQLDEALKTGALLTDDFLPAFSKGIEETFGPQAAQSAIEGTQASLNRLSNAWNELLMEINDGQVKQGMSYILDTFKDGLEYAKEMAKYVKYTLDFSKVAPAGKGFERFQGNLKEMAQAEEAFGKLVIKEEAFRKAQADVVKIPSTDKYYVDFKELRDKLGRELLILQKDFKTTFGIEYKAFYKEVYGDVKSEVKKYNDELTEEQKKARDRIVEMGKMSKEIQKALNYSKAATPGEDIRQRKSIVADIYDKAVEAQKKATEYFKANSISDILITDLEKYSKEMKLTAPQKELLSIDTSKLKEAIKYLGKAEEEVLDKQARKIVQNIDLREMSYTKAIASIKEMGLTQTTEGKALSALNEKNIDYVDALIKRNLSRIDLLKIELSNMKAQNLEGDKQVLLNKAILDTEKEIAMVSKSKAEIFVNSLREQGKTYKEIRQEAQAASEQGELQKEVYDQMGSVIETKVSKEIKSFKRSYGLARAEIDPMVAKIQEWANLGEITNEEMERYIDLVEGKAVKATEKLSEEYKKFNNLVSSSITNINEGVADAILGLDKNFSDVLDNMAKSWAKFYLETQILQPILGDPTKGASPTNGIIGALFSGFTGQKQTSQPSASPISPENDYLGLSGYSLPTNFGASLLGMSPKVVAPKTSTSVQINNYSQSKVEAQPTTDANGNVQLRIMVRDEMKAAVLDGTLDRSASSAWGVKRVGVK